MKALLLIIMIFLHIVADCYLHGILNEMMLKEWWTKQSDNHSLNKYGYIVALTEHSLVWTFIIMSPIMVIMMHNNLYSSILVYYIIFLMINTLTHAVMDDLKDNKHAINFAQNQSIHITFVIGTWFVFIAKGLV